MIPVRNVVSVTKLVTILSYELSPSFSTEGERHNFWELVYVDRGRIYCRADWETRLLKQGEMIIHRPNEFHSVACDGTESASVFIITFDCTSTFMKLLNKESYRISGERAQLMRKLIAECNRTFSVSEYPLRLLENAPVGGAQLTGRYLEELLILLIREEGRGVEGGAVLDGGISVDTTLAQEICDYLKAHVCEKVTLDGISQRFHFGKSRLCDIFKRAEGDTIVGYHTKLKIAEAKRMLFEKRLTVSEIAAQLGFESPEYFSRTFRKHTGTSPRAFRSSLVSGDSTRYLEKELKLN